MQAFSFIIVFAPSTGRAVGGEVVPGEVQSSGALSLKNSITIASRLPSRMDNAREVIKI